MLDSPPFPALFASALSSTSDFYHDVARCRKQKVYRWEVEVYHQLVAL